MVQIIYGPTFYVNYCLIFDPSKDEIDDVYDSLRGGLKIEDDGYINKYIGIDINRCPYGLIHIRQPYLTQSIINMIPGMEKSSANPTPAFKPPLAKNDGAQTRKNDFIIDR